MSKFGWSYPPGAANDPNAPYNQDYDDSIKPKIHWDVRRLVRSLVGNDGLGAFYRACYKGSDCGVSIGFDIDGEAIYNDDLYKFGKSDHKFWLDHTINGIMINGYVEGSDVELEPFWFEDDVTEHMFFETMETIDKEASFYWDRDNSTWFYADYTPVDKETTRFYGKNTLGEITFSRRDVPKYIERKVAEFFNRDDIECDFKGVSLGLGVTITEYINNTTW